MANVNVVKFGAFYNEGSRGARGGAASNDKVWGIAEVNGALVTFWGRRNGVLKFKTQPGAAGRAKAMTKWEEKTGARRDGGDIYVAVTNELMQRVLCPTLKRDVEHFFYSAMSRGTLNTKH